MSGVLADTVLVLHAAFVAFIVGGLLAIWIGAALHWRWVRRFWFRLIHLVAMAAVAAESLLGIMCPLTVWEDALRGTHENSVFVQRWLHRILFYEFPSEVFVGLYLLFLVAIALTWWRVPPARPAAPRRTA